MGRQVDGLIQLIILALLTSCKSVISHVRHLLVTCLSCLQKRGEVMVA